MHDTPQENNTPNTPGETPEIKPHGAEHLVKHQWKKGIGGNPNGRPKKEKLIGPHLAEFMSEPISLHPGFKNHLLRLGYQEEDIEDWTLAKYTALQLTMQSIKGKPIQMLELLNRVDGKVQEKSEDVSFSVDETLAIVSDIVLETLLITGDYLTSDQQQTVAAKLGRLQRITQVRALVRSGDID